MVPKGAGRGRKMGKEGRSTGEGGGGGRRVRWKSCKVKAAGAARERDRH